MVGQEMIVLDAIIRSAINPALKLLPPRMDSDAARVEMLAITLREADAIHRIQHANGPAHGLWQMEEGGGVRGVMHHPSSRDFARAACSTRLLLWTDFHPLPDVDAPAAEGWDYYLRNWRPGCIPCPHSMQ